MGSLMVSLEITEFVLYCKILGHGQGVFDNLLKSTCQRPEQRYYVPWSNTVLSLMMDTCSLSKKEMHQSLQSFPIDNSDLVMSWNRYTLHALV